MARKPAPITKKCEKCPSTARPGERFCGECAGAILAALRSTYYGYTRHTYRPREAQEDIWMTKYGHNH